MASFIVTLATDAGIVEADVIAAAKTALAQIENIIVTDVAPALEADVLALVQKVEEQVDPAANTGNTD